MKTTAVVLALLLTGCAASFTLQEKRQERLPSNTTVGLVALDSRQKPTQEALEAYLTVAIMAQGHKVKTLRLEQLADRETLFRILSPEMYEQTSPPASPAPGGARRRVTEMHDAHNRLLALARLAKDLPTVLGVNHLVFVTRFAAYGFAAYVVDLRKRLIINAMVVSGTREGFAQALDTPTGKRLNAEDGDRSQMELMRFAQALAGRL